MGRRWVVDARNVMGARPDGWWRDPPQALVRLLDEITRWRHETGDPVLVVVDGHPGPRVPEGAWYGVEVRYAHTTERDAADDEIVREVAARRDGGSSTVVTSDRRLRGRVEDLGAETVGAKRFLDLVADIEPRRRDRAILARFGIDESALLGRGGEARVFALDRERVLRLPHPAYPLALLDDRRRLLDALSAGSPPVAIPEVLAHEEVDGRIVVIERRLPGGNALDALAAPGTDRAALVRHHLDVAGAIANLPFPGAAFGELYGDHALQGATFRGWAEGRLRVSLATGGDAFTHLDAGVLTDDLLAALPDGEPERPRLVHLDGFLGNMLAEGDQVTALLDFGPMTIGGPAHLDPLVAIAYLTPEITPTATAADRAVAEAWAADAGLAGAVTPAERWIAAYWTGAPDDQRLRSWCERTLLSA